MSILPTMNQRIQLNSNTSISGRIEKNSKKPVSAPFWEADLIQASPAFLRLMRRNTFLTKFTPLTFLIATAAITAYPFATNFNPEINIREVSANGSYWENGRWIETKPMEIKREYDFAGVGKKEMYLLHHEEIESLAINIKGVKRIRFFMTFGESYLRHLKCLENVGMTSIEPIMFEGKENITFTYMGFEGAKVLGPRPQLTRVFVNLLVNAMQAIGDEPDGHVVVSVRNSVQDGYYDIVFEDDGPGVSDEDIPKLFTPKFTTKSGGSGLGLAMCRSVLDTCGATISYQRSFSLGGACFTICYPKPPAAETTSDGSISGQDSR